MISATTASGGLYFQYNDNGLRVSKIKNGIETVYYYDGTRLVGEQNQNETILYVYDDTGIVIGMQYRLTTYAEDTWDVYWFERNLQGDIVGVYNKSGTKLISYTYDAWGNFTTTYYNNGASTSAVKNPFRYRGYYYDSDLKLYYLQTRYYDSVTGRFISADSTDLLTATPNALTDKNLYAYCDNNPVMRTDRDGEFWVSMLVGAGIGLLGQLTSDLITSAIEGELSISHWSSYLGAAVGGAVGAFLPKNALGSAVTSAVTNAATKLAYDLDTAIMGRSDYYRFEEIFCTSLYSFINGAAETVAFKSSKLSKVIPEIKLLGTENELEDIVSSILSGATCGVYGQVDFPPKKLSWKSPTPARYYPTRGGG